MNIKLRADWLSVKNAGNFKLLLHYAQHNQSKIVRKQFDYVQINVLMADLHMLVDLMHTKHLYSFGDESLILELVRENVEMDKYIVPDERVKRMGFLLGGSSNMTLQGFSVVFKTKKSRHISTVDILVKKFTTWHCHHHFSVSEMPYSARDPADVGRGFTEPKFNVLLP